MQEISEGEARTDSFSVSPRIYSSPRVALALRLDHFGSSCATVFVHPNDAPMSHPPARLVAGGVSEEDGAVFAESYETLRRWSP